MRLGHRLLLGLAFLLSALVPSAAHAGAGEGVGYRLTGEAGSNLTAGFIRLPATPGSTVTARFVAVNSTKKPAVVSFYGADGNTTLATGVVYGGKTTRDVGGWMTPSRSTATLAAGSELPVEVLIRVPSGASVGDHVGGIVMEQRDGASTATITQVVRYAIPVLVDIEGGSGPQLALGGAKMSRIRGTTIATVILPLSNTGSRICRPDVLAQVDGKDGSSITVQRRLDEVLPGDQIAYPLRIASDLGPGRYVVRVEVTGCGTPVSSTSTSTLESQDVSASGATVPKPASSPSVSESVAIPPVPLKRVKKKKASAAKSSSSTNSSGVGTSRADGGTTDGAGSKAVTPLAKPRAKSGAKGWLQRASSAVADNAPKVLERASLPLGATALVGLLFFFQNALDRRDPKLVGAPRERERDLRFDPNPLQS